MRGARIAAIAGAIIVSAAASHSYEGESAATYWAKERGQAVPAFGVLPSKITREPRGSRLLNAAIVEAAARREGVPVALARNLTRQESGFNHLARSPVGAMGLTQIMPGTWRAEGCKGNPWRAEDNAACGMRYLAKFYRQGGAQYAALRYHGGPNTRMHGPKTKHYARVVTAGLQEAPSWAGSLPVRFAMR